jgi:hypothetical protein
MQGRELVELILLLLLLLLLLFIIYLFTAIGIAPASNSPTLVQTKTVKQHYTIKRIAVITQQHTVYASTLVHTLYENWTTELVIL